MSALKWGLFIAGWVLIDMVTWHLGLTNYLIGQVGALALFVSGAIYPND